ncbi:MAG: DNA-processing protein DprA, partial [Clostridia bacterium]|nr:DNA-processing protein DprA [Clostridia bacterium]
MLIDDNLMENNILWLERFEFLQYNKKYKLMQLFSDDDIKRDFCSKKYQILTFLNQDEYEKMAEEYRTNSMANKIENYKKQGIKLITLYSAEYPEYLKNSINPPLCLYCLGNTQLLNTTCCAVVGTRKPSEYGKIITKSFVKELANAKVTIVSGMAVGVDTISHETTLAESGATIAVIAGGFNHIYPASNYNLFKRMTINNFVVSESPPDTLP